MVHKYTLSIIVVLCSVYLVTAYLPYKKTIILDIQSNISPLNQSKMVHDLRAQKQAIHDECLVKIRTEFAIPDEIWAEFMGRFDKLIKKDDLVGSSSLRASDSDHPYRCMVQKLLLEYGINLAKVTIKLIDYGSSPAQVVQTLFNDNSAIMHSIEINIPLMNRYTKEMQEALLRHEIMHLLNYDSIESSFIIGMLNNCGYNAQICDNSPAIIAFRQQRELRADALASCNHPEVARALQTDFEKAIPEQDQENPALWKFHPSSQARYDQMAQILSTMDQEQPILVA